MQVPCNNPHLQPKREVNRRRDCPGPAEKTHGIDCSNLLAAGKESYSTVYNVNIAQKVKLNQNLLTLYS